MKNIMKPVCDQFYINIDAMYSDFEAAAVYQMGQVGSTVRL